MVAVIRKVASKQEVLDGLRGLGDADLRRLEWMARLRSIGLHGIEWQDLLHEAIARTLDGTRQWPKEVSIIVFLRETMRSIASDHWRRESRSPVLMESQLRDTSDDVEGSVLETVADPVASPERDAAVSEALSQIKLAFSGDPKALRVIVGMAMGKSPREIQEEGQMDARQYASTQRRIRRTLARLFPDGRPIQ